MKEHKYKSPRNAWLIGAKEALKAHGFNPEESMLKQAMNNALQTPLAQYDMIAEQVCRMINNPTDRNLEGLRRLLENIENDNEETERLNG